MAQTPNVYLDPAHINTQVGQTVEMRLRVQNVSGLYGLDVRVDFEPSLLEVLDTDSEREGVQVTSGEFPYPDFMVRNTVDNAAGTIWYAAIQLNPREPANGSGVMLTMRLRAKATGTAIVGLSSAQLVNRDGVEIATTKASGQVAIAGAGGSTPPPALPTYTPTSVEPSPTTPPTATLAPQVGATSTATGVPLIATLTPALPTPGGVAPTATLTPGATASPTSAAVPGQTLSPTPPSLPGTTLTPLTSYPILPLTTPTAGGLPPALPPALPALGTPTGGSATRAATAARTALLTSTAPRGTRAVTTTRAATTVAPTLAPTSALVAAVIPTARPPATPAPLRQVVRPLIPQGMFICLAILLVLLAAVLFLYLARQSRRAIE